MERRTTQAARPPAGRALAATLVGLAGVAWLASAWLASPGMRLGVLTGASMRSAQSQMGMSGSMSMPMSTPMPMDMGLGIFIVTWTVMMVAMMIPSAVPAVRRFDTWARATGQPGSASLLYIAGYLLVWSLIGGVAYLMMQALDDWLPAARTAELRVGALLLVVAGLYQVLPLKQACLHHCRSSCMRTHRPSPTGAMHAGIGQGVCCLGSCWPLMLVLLLVGMMNLAWMGVIAGVIFVEKVMPGGALASKVVGWGLVVLGIILLAAPHALPALI